MQNLQNSRNSRRKHKEKPFQPWFRYIFLGIQNTWNIQEQLTSSYITGLKAKGYRYFGQSLAVSYTFHHILTVGTNHPASKYSRRERKTYIHTKTSTQMFTDSLSLKCQTSPYMSVAAAKALSRVRLLATPWTAAYQAPPSMEFSRQEYWSGVPLPFPPYMSITC